MRPAITVCPKRVKPVPVSTTASPVTVTAEVAVNRLWVQVIGAVVAKGNLSSRVPRTIKLRKLNDRIRGGAA